MYVLHEISWIVYYYCKKKKKTHKKQDYHCLLTPGLFNIFLLIQDRTQIYNRIFILQYTCVKWNLYFAKFHICRRNFFSLLQPSFGELLPLYDKTLYLSTLNYDYDLNLVYCVNGLKGLRLLTERMKFLKKKNNQGFQLEMSKTA